MRKVRLSVTGLIFLLMMLCVPMTASAQNVGVDVTEVDFGDVDVGDSATVPITLTSLGPTPLSIHHVTFMDDAGGVFTVEGDDYRDEMHMGDSVVVHLTFTPDDVIDYVGELWVISNDRDSPVTYLDAFGTGTEPPTPEGLIADLVEFVDDAVDSEVLDGSGPNEHVREISLTVFVERLELAASLLSTGRTIPACNVLRWLESVSDGLATPPDFIEGPARADVHEQLVRLIAEAGC